MAVDRNLPLEDPRGPGLMGRTPYGRNVINQTQRPPAAAPHVGGVPLNDYLDRQDQLSDRHKRLQMEQKANEIAGAIRSKNDLRNLMRMLEDENIPEEKRAISEQAAVIAANRLRQAEAKTAQNIAADQAAIEEETGGSAVLHAAMEAVGGLRDISRSVGSSLIIEPLAGLVGLGTLGATTLMGEANPNAAANNVRRVQGLTPAIDNEGAQRLLSPLAGAMMGLEENIDDLSIVIGQGNPMASAAVKTTLLGIPEIVGTRVGAKSGAAIKRSIKEVEKLAAKAGVDLKPKTFSEQVIAAARDQVGTFRGEGSAVVAKAVQDRQDALRASREAAFEKAKRQRVYMRVDKLEGLRNNLVDEFIDDGTISQRPVFNEDGRITGTKVEAPAKLRGLLDQLDGLVEGTKQMGSRGPHLREIERLRRGIEKRLSKTGDAKSDIPLNKMKNALDDFIDRSFADDAIANGESIIVSGKNATEKVDAWKEYFKVDRDYAAKFKPDKILRVLLDRNATVAEYRKFLIGANSIAGKDAGSRTVKRLRDVLGDRAPELELLRQDYLYDLYSPLLSDAGPQWAQFLRNYEKMVKGPAQEVVDQLGLNNKDVSFLERMAKQAMKTRDPAAFDVDLATAISRAATGHAIARAGLRVSLSASVLRLLIANPKTTRADIIANLAGVDRSMVGRAFIDRTGPVGGAAAGAILSSQLHGEGNEE